MKDSYRLIKFQGLDAIRGILAIVVCFGHGWQIFLLEPGQPITGYGAFLAFSSRLAVIWFFCISGYVITLSIIKNIERHGGFNLLEYAISRFFRIMPPLLAVISMAYILAQVASIFEINHLPSGISGARETFVVDVRSQIYCIVSLCSYFHSDLQGGLNGPLWTLQYEIQLYVIFGLLFSLLFLRCKLVFKIILLLALLIYFDQAFSLRTLTGKLVPQFLWYLNFTCGCAAFLFFNKLKNAWLWVAAAFGAVVAAGIMITTETQYFIADLDTDFYLMLAQLSLAISFSMLTVQASRFNAGKSLARLGGFSYTLYISHFPLMLFVYFILVNVGVDFKSSLFEAIGIWWVVVLGCIVISYRVAKVIENAPAQRALVKIWVAPLLMRFSPLTSKKRSEKSTD